MNSAMHTEPRSSVSSLPEHRRNRPPRSWFVIRHRCHCVKQRLCLAIQTTIELARIERTASAKAPGRPVGNCSVTCRAARLERCCRTRRTRHYVSCNDSLGQACRTLTKHSSATARIVSTDWQPCRKLPPSMNAKFDSERQSRPPNQAKFVAIGPNLV